MRRLLVLILASVAICNPALAAVPNDVIVDESFDGDVLAAFDDGAWGFASLASGHVGPGLNAIIPVGQHWGGAGHWEFDRRGVAEPEELYWRYWVKFPTGFYIETPNRGKLPGPAGLHSANCRGNRVSTPEEPCFSARMLFSRLYGEPADPDGPDDKTLLGFYTYHVDGPSNRGDIWTWDPEVALLDHGKWYCVEGFIEMNTPGARDGVLRGWVDGEDAFQRTDIAFRRADEAWMKIKSLWFDVYYGGTESIVHNEIHFDSLAFGPSRIGCDDSGEYTPPFWDDDDSVFEADIIWLADSGITQGCNPPTNDKFCPGSAVTRGQMAAFLTRALSLPVPAGVDTFVDDNDSVFEANIEALAAAGITAGCNPPANDRFCPEQRLSRGQMAAFLTRAYGYPSVGGDRFVDDNDSIFESAIESLAAAGITAGCNPPVNDRFCPEATLTRGQMAAFLHRAAG
ncbi:MAG: S-layer homology domain-containing protein [Acidimicrobiia bacterium]|nr:S-layer homology domain-containing protein [Acidimicrobiia bacterium]